MEVVTGGGSPKGGGLAEQGTPFGRARLEVRRDLG